MSVSKKQIEEWIAELEIDWKSHGVTKKELVAAAAEEEDPRGYLEELAQLQEDADDDSQEDPADAGEEGSDVPAEEDASEPEGQQYARQGSDQRPLCPRHQCFCTARSTPGPFTYYQCPEPGCLFSTKVPRQGMQQLMQRHAERRARQPRVDPRS